MARGRLTRVYTAKKRTGKPSKAVKNYVQRRVQSMGEMKHHRVYRTAELETTTTPDTDCLSTISQGDARGNREGKQINARGLTVRYQLNPDSSNNAGDSVRVIIWQFKGDSADKNPETDPNTEQIIWENNDNFFAQLASPFRKDLKDYKILWDKHHKIPVVGNVALGNDERYQVVRIPAKKLLNNIRYNSGSNFGTNQIYLTVLGSIASGGNLGTRMNYSSELAFKDL